MGPSDMKESPWKMLNALFAHANKHSAAAVKKENNIERHFDSSVNAGLTSGYWERFENDSGFFSSGRVSYLPPANQLKELGMADNSVEHNSNHSRVVWIPERNACCQPKEL